jgi:sRNA-binding regulator protein Hfq
MEIKGKRKRFLLAGKELNENISKFPAFVMMVKKEKNKLLFFERKVEDAEELKKLDKSSIIGIYPMEEKI